MPASTTVGVCANAARATARSWASSVGRKPETVPGRHPATAATVIRRASASARGPSSSQRSPGVSIRGWPSAGRAAHRDEANTRSSPSATAAASRGGSPRVWPASPPAAVATSAIPCARAATSGCRSANAMIAMPPIECPPRTSGPSGATAAITAARSSASWSIVIVAGSTAAERPWPAVVVADDPRVERAGDRRPGGGVQGPAVGQHDGHGPRSVDLDVQRDGVGRGDVHQTRCAFRHKISAGPPMMPCSRRNGTSLRADQRSVPCQCGLASAALRPTAGSMPTLA